jgi:segregation and condensation protein A
MDGPADPNNGLERPTVNETPSAVSTAGGHEEGEGGSPYLTLDGFTGPLDHLLTLARAQTIDLAEISLTALLDQLATALREAPATIPLEQKGDWVVMAVWLVQLRARLLLPADMPGRPAATAEADQLRVRLVALAAMQALAGWLARRPQLGRDVFARGRPEGFGGSLEAGAVIDVVEFLWASLALFDDEVPPVTTTAYQPAPLALHSVAEARARIRRRLSAQPDGVPLDQLLPDASPDAGDASRRALHRRAGWATTFVAGLELARQGTLVMAQGDDFEPIHLALA